MAILFDSFNFIIYNVISYFLDYDKFFNMLFSLFFLKLLLMKKLSQHNIF